jgi:hypothetical protein
MTGRSQKAEARRKRQAQRHKGTKAQRHKGTKAQREKAGIKAQREDRKPFPFSSDCLFFRILTPGSLILFYGNPFIFR